MVACLTFALSPALAQAGTLDQEQSGTPDFAGSPTNTLLHAQTFTAGLTGQLDQVDLLLDRDGDPSGDLTVEIRETSGGEPTNTVLDSATIPEGDVPSGGFAFVAVAVNAPSVAGTQYAIVLMGPSDDGYNWGGFGSDPYPGGMAQRSTNGGTSWGAGDGTRDFGFKTYVEQPACATPVGDQNSTNNSVYYSYSADVIADGPVGYWRLGESSGPTAFDSSGNANHGTYTGTFTFGVPGAIAGDPDTAVDFSPDVKARVPTPLAHAAFGESSVRTFEGWACREENKGFDTFFSGDKRFASPGMWTDHGDLDRIWFDPRREGGSGPRFWDGVMPPDGEWFYWVLIFDDPANTAELFINGLSEGTRSVTEPPHSSPGNFQIGNYAQINEAWNGPLDEVAVYERALSASEICLHYNAGTAGTTIPFC